MKNVFCVFPITQHSEFFFLITNIIIYYFCYSGYSVSMKIINCRYAFAPQGWELKFFYRDITLPTKVHLVKAMVFPVIMYGCESCTIKKAECRRIDAFELWCWRRLLRVPWTARRSNQSILREINQSWIFIGKTDAKAETPILWPLDAKDWLIWKDAGKDWTWEEKGSTEDEMVGWHHQLQWTWVWVNSGSWWSGKPGVLQSMGSQRVGHDWETELN